MAWFVWAAAWAEATKKTGSIRADLSGWILGVRMSLAIDNAWCYVRLLPRYPKHDALFNRSIPYEAGWLWLMLDAHVQGTRLEVLF